MLLKVEELAAELRVHPWTIRQWRKKGFITAYGGERSLRYDLVRLSVR